jgi:hypothetical protein
MRWTSFIEQHRHRREAALHAAQRWEAGDCGPARDLLATWRFDADLRGRVLDRLAQTPPQPTPDALGATLAPDAAWMPAHPDADLAEHVWIERLQPTSLASDPVRQRAWALAELHRLGTHVDQRRRAPWRQPLTIAPEAEAHAAAWWTAWLTCSPWTVQASCDAVLWPVAQSAYAAILSATAMTPAMQHVRLADFRDAFSFLFLASEACGEIAARVIETLAPDPITALAGCLDETSRLRAGRCAVARGHGPTTADLVFGQVRGAQVRGRLLAEQMQTPERLDQMLDLHIALRLCDRWTTPEHTSWARNWECVIQNRGRARARLRAVVSALPPDVLRARLATVDQLGARTIQAVRSFVRGWAWQEARLGWPGNPSRRVDPPCPVEADTPYGEDEHGALRAWVMLVILRGRIGHLQRWVESGSTGDRDATWGRLLSQSLPENLRGGGSARLALQRVRAELTLGLSEIMTELLPVTRQLAAMENSPPPIAAFHAALRPIWHDSIPLPQVRVRRYVQHAAHAELGRRLMEMTRR